MGSIHKKYQQAESFQVGEEDSITNMDKNKGLGPLSLLLATHTNTTCIKTICMDNCI